MGSKTSKTKPDNVADNPGIMHYPTNVGAPAFTVPDVLGKGKERGITATHQLETKFEQLKEEYFKLVALAEDTQMVYNARCNFIPVVGRVYHLYDSESGLFLSLIEPESWQHKKHLGSYKLSSEQTWEKQ
ncbi:DUF2452 domain-containing protein [bacterium]|nr:DUF2452 domain-containing protein [bacterium]